MRSILNREFKYIPASTHDASSLAFRRRQQQRLRDAQAQAAEAQAKVAPIKRRQAGKIDIDALVAIECIGLAAIVFAAMAFGYI
jgi:hypothetical protein